MTNIISAIVTAYDYGTQKYSSWEGLKGLIYKDATSDDSWFTVAGAYIAGKLHLSYFIMFFCMLCNQVHRLPRKDKMSSMRLRRVKTNMHSAHPSASCMPKVLARQIKKLLAN